MAAWVLFGEQIAVDGYLLKQINITLAGINKTVHHHHHHHLCSSSTVSDRTAPIYK
jgi:hypothetical protein